MREQLTPRRADARADVVGFQQHGARGAQVCVEPVVPLLLVLEILGGDVRRGRRLTRFGRELVEALRRVREARGQLGDRSLQREGERVALGAQGLQTRVVEVLVPKRRFSRGQRRPRLVEVEPMGLLRARAPKPREDQGENDPAQQAQCGRRLHCRLDGPRHDSAALPLSSDHGRAAAATRTLTERSPWAKVRGCAPGPALLKGAKDP